MSNDNVVQLFPDWLNDNYGYEVDIAVEHIRKGFYDDDDLRIAGITREEAEAFQRSRTIEDLAHRHPVEVLRAALALAEGRGT